MITGKSLGIPAGSAAAAPAETDDHMAAEVGGITTAAVNNAMKDILENSGVPYCFAPSGDGDDAELFADAESQLGSPELVEVVDPEGAFRNALGVDVHELDCSIGECVVTTRAAEMSSAMSSQSAGA